MNRPFPRYALLLAAVLSLWSFPAHATSELPDIRDNPSFDGILGDFFELDLGESLGGMDISRLFFIGVRNERRIVSLTTETHPASRAIALDSNVTGYIVSRTVAINLGFGPNWLFSPGSFLSPGAGVMPLIGSRAFVRSYAKTLAEAKDVSIFKMPHQLSEITDWHAGDKVLYMGSGGVAFSAGIGLQGIIGAGARVFVDGDWLFAIQKLDEDYARACVTRGTARTVSASAGTAISFVEASRIHAFDRSFCFRLAFRAPEAQESYRLLFRGAIDKVQEIEKTSPPWLIYESKDQTVSRGKFFTWFLGLPELIFAYKTSGSLRTASDTEIFESNDEHAKVDTFASAYLNEKARGGFFINDKSTRSDFAAILQKRESLRGEISSTYGAQYRWTYVQNPAKKSSYQKAIARLIAGTGLRDIVDSDLPDGALGYLETRLTVDYSAKAMDALCSIPPQTLELAAWKRFNTYFDADSDPDQLCKRHPFCRHHYENSVEEALEKAASATLEFCMTSNGPDYVQSASRLGNAILANQFTFGALLDVLPQGTVQIGFKISGERIVQRNILLKR